MFVQAMKPDADADLLLAQMGIVPTPPPVGDMQTQETLEVVREEPNSKAEVLEEIQTESAHIRTTTMDKPVEEAEQPLLTPEEVVADLEARSPKATEAEKDAEVCGDRVDGWNSTERVEKSADVTLETGGKENHTERVEKGAPRNEAVHIYQRIPTRENHTKRVAPRNEAARARATTMHIYQRIPTREEASGKKSTEGQPRATPGKSVDGGEDRPVRSAVEPLRRMRRLLIDEELEEEEEDVIFTLVDMLPNSGPPAPPAEAEDSERERKERKRKGKAVAALVEKKPRQASSTLVIREGRQRIEEDDNEEEEALRMERRSKRRNYRARGTSEQRPEIARVQLKK